MRGSLLFVMRAAISKRRATTAVEEVVPKGWSGEGEAHRTLKEAIALHPEWLGLPKNIAPGKVEALLYSGDRVDVVVSTSRLRIAVEVKAHGAQTGDLVRGLFRCVKYAAVLEAESKAWQNKQDSRAMLALGGALPTGLKALRAVLSVDVVESLGRG
jgi:hypothetical protein